MRNGRRKFTERFTSCDKVQLVYYFLFEIFKKKTYTENVTASEKESYTTKMFYRMLIITKSHDLRLKNNISDYKLFKKHHIVWSIQQFKMHALASVVKENNSYYAFRF